MSRIRLGGVVGQLHRLASVPAPEVSDGQLLERFNRAGEEAAFEALVRRHGPLVLGVCRRVLRDSHAAEDAFQATFLALLRRAHALDRQGSLAGWLHTVAYHVALKARANSARRRRREEAAATPDAIEPQVELLWRELRPILDEELDRLPEGCRAPVVLCYLEGRTNEEASRLLGWPVGTVKSRLARARELLRARLTRRGVTLSAGLFSGSLGQALAAVPRPLARHTVQAALRSAEAGLASPTAVALAEGALRTMSLARPKMVVAFLLLAGLTALGLGAFTGQAEAQRHDPRPADPPAQAGATDPRLALDRAFALGKRPGEAQPAKPGRETTTLTGRVLGGDGKPQAGARVALVGGVARGPVPKVLAEARTDRLGWFRLSVPRPGPGQEPRHEAVMAWAPGHGLAWQYPLPDKGKEVELQLPPEEVIRGRLIDLQGQPAAGVKLWVTRLGERTAPNGWVVYRRVKAVFFDNDEVAPVIWRRNTMHFYTVDSMAWSGHQKAEAQSPKKTPPPPASVVVQEPPRHLPGWPEAVTTDKEGRFVLRGVGKGQGVGLLIDDERFALQVLDFPAQDRAAEVTRVLAAARVLEGTVTDADTGKPIPNTWIRVSPPGSYGRSVSGFSESLASTDHRGRRGMGGWVRTVVNFLAIGGSEDGEELPPLAVRTDEKGRYRFHLFRAGSYSLRVNGPAGQQYLHRDARISWPGEAVVRQRLDLTLQRGALVRGRVTEAPGGKPLAGARVDLWCKGLKLPPGTSHPRELTTGKDGTFEALLPPGSWHLLVNGTEPVYVVQKIPIARLTDEQPPEGLRIGLWGPDGKITTQEKVDPGPYFYPDAWAAVDLKPGAERDVPVTLRRAALLRGRVVGPDGKPVPGVYLARRPVVPPEPTVTPEKTTRQVAYDVQRPKEKDPVMWRVVVLGRYSQPRYDVIPVELLDGTFTIPVLLPEATYRLHFLDSTGQLGAVAELSGKQAGGELVTVRLQPCGQAAARLVDSKGKPLIGHRPLLWMLLPPGPHAAPSDLSELLSHNLRAHDAVWSAYLDPGRHGDGPRSDAEGRITLPALIPGATYRVLLGSGKARDFTVTAGRTAELGDLTIDPPSFTEKLPTVRLKK